MKSTPTSTPAIEKDFFLENNCFDENGQLKYEITEANGLTYLVDTKNTPLAPNEERIYPHQDEATQLLKSAKSLGEHYDIVIDAFSGAGHSILPIIDQGIANKGIGIDLNLRATELAKINGKANGIEVAEFRHGDVQSDLPQSDQKTLYIANPPFALQAKGGPELEQMRNGGENGLLLTKAYLQQAISKAKSGDAIIGVAYSRIGSNGQIELEQEIQNTLQENGSYQISIIKGEKLWRGPNGKKEQPNPMPLSAMHTKALPDDQKAIAAYNAASEYHQSQGWIELGYFEYIIKIDKAAEIQTDIHDQVENTSQTP